VDCIRTTKCAIQKQKHTNTQTHNTKTQTHKKYSRKNRIYCKYIFYFLSPQVARMCRLYLLWKREPPQPTRLEHFLLDTATSPTSRKTSDGYGLAGFSEKTHRWKIYKSIHTHSEDPHKTRVLNEFANYSFVIGHLRRNPKWSQHTPENTHPFIFQNQVFAQNGDIHGLHEQRELVIRRITPELRKSISGTTDTELFFYLYITIMREIMAKPVEHEPRFETYQIQVLYYAMIQTLGFFQKHFTKLTSNVIYANKQYTIITRHFYSRSANSFHDRSMLLYWNIPKSKMPNILAFTCEDESSSVNIHSPKRGTRATPETIFITTKCPETLHDADNPSTEKLYLFPIHTLVCIENATGKLWRFPILC
jgi:hypothetical protein